MSVLLTDKSVATLPALHGKSGTLYTDTELPGFGVRVNVGGARAWTVQYKTRVEGAALGIAQRTCIGYWPEMNASEARRLASAVREVGLQGNLHPTEALRRLTGNGSRGVAGERHKRPRKWTRMQNRLDKVIRYAYMLALEARYGAQPDGSVNA